MIQTMNPLRVIKAMTMIQTLPEVEDVELSEEAAEAKEEMEEQEQEEGEDGALLPVAETPGARDLEMTWTVHRAG